LSESEKRYRTLFETIHDGILIVNEEGRYVDVNRSLCRILKAQREQLIGAHFSEFIPPERLDEAHKAFAALLTNAEVPAEFPLRALDGSIVELEWSSPSDYLPGLHFCVCREITDRKRSEAAAIDSERQLRTLADSIPNLAWMADAEGSIIWYNQRWYEYTGTTAEQTVGWGWQAVHDPEMLPAVMERWQASVRTGDLFEMEFPLRGASGEFRWFLTRVTPVRNVHGSVIRWFGTNTDIHEFRRSQEERQQLLSREQEARRTAELLNDVGPLLAGELDSTRLVQAVTDLATKLVGAEFGAFFHNVENAQGESYLLYTLSGAPAEAFAKFPMPRNTAVFGPTFHGESVVRSDDITKDVRYGRSAPYHGMPQGHLPVKSYLAVPVMSRLGEVMGGLFFGHATSGMFSENDERLVSGIAAQAAIAMDNARLFEQIKRERARAEETNRALRRANSDLEQFAYSASHDLQEPLRMVALYSEMLRRKFAGQLGADADLFIKYTKEGAIRMERLLNDLLAYTRASALSEKPIEAFESSRALERAIHNLQTAIEQSGASIEHSALPKVSVEEVHLEQIFQNLIGNAIKYRSAEPPHVVIGAERRAGEWLFSVKDNAMGISPQYKEQIFGMFKRLHTAAEYSGTGMGLAICQRIIERYGGRIWVESELGQGSTFFFTLPASHL
jgi:PAS domain S-box-containing protein